MLTACVKCKKLEYTEESPLWFFCNHCITHTNCKNCGTEKHRRNITDGLCAKCYRLSQEHTYYCDGCGYDYPKRFLSYVGPWDGYFCARCNRKGDDEYESHA